MKTLLSAKNLIWHPDYGHGTDFLMMTETFLLNGPLILTNDLCTFAIISFSLSLFFNFCTLFSMVGLMLATICLS
jgi:hypothetical protein